MSQMYPMEPYEQSSDAVVDYRQQSRTFLAKSRDYLAEGDLHQAAEKGWGAAAWMAKAVAEAKGWQYRKHEEFFTVMYQAEALAGDARVNNLRSVANELHGFFYTRRMFLRADAIGRGLDQMELLLDILQPLTEPEPSG